jgi:purine-nucleoside phosphorylase
MMDQFGRKEFEAAASALRERSKQTPEVGLVLGSGLGSLAQAVTNADVIPYDAIPHWPRSTVQGHQGELYIGQLEGQNVMIMRGRAHFYEGYPLSQITLPIRVMQLMGIKTLVLTNAAGGINQSYTPGELMLICDHINLVGMAGHSPLLGPNDDTLGPRFPGMTQIYDRRLRQLALEAAREKEVPMHEGVYAGLSGPTFESPAEIRYLRTIGADAVGMSTVHEAVVARHAPQDHDGDRRLRVLGISGITNKAIDDPDSDQEATHQEVLDTGKVLVPRLENVVRGVLQKLSSY